MARNADAQMDQARHDAHLSESERFPRYFALGGMTTSLPVGAFLLGALLPSPHDHHALALAVNERFSEAGGDRPIPDTAET
jgi:hypothetical protein